jgi:ureidoacrylate peracid hydrolase
MNASVAETALGAAPADTLADWIAPSRTAVIVIDIQVDFASPDGVLGRAGVDMSVVQPAVAAAERLVALARKAGVPVVFVGLQTAAALDSPTWRERMRRQGADPSADSAVCRVGEYGAQFVGPTPLPGELVIAKIRYSSFFGTNLNAGLKAMGVDTLLVCGLTTECCIDSTVRDAFHLDYHVFVASNASAAYDPAIHEATLTILEQNCAILVSVDEVQAAWAGATARG